MMFCVAHEWNRLNERVLMRDHNIQFSGVVWKIIPNYHCYSISRALTVVLTGYVTC